MFRIEELNELPDQISVNMLFVVVSVLTIESCHGESVLGRYHDLGYSLIDGIGQFAIV